MISWAQNMHLIINQFSDTTLQADSFEENIAPKAGGLFEDDSLLDHGRGNAGGRDQPPSHSRAGPQLIYVDNEADKVSESIEAERKLASRASIYGHILTPELELGVSAEVST